MKKLIEDILRGRRTDAATLPLRIVLSLLSVVYGFIVSVRNFMYDRAVLKTKNAPCRVVCVGNVTVGGTGKTPVVIMTARMLAGAGLKTAVVSRGYGRKGNGVAVVSDGVKILLPPGESGDEPHILATELDDVPVVVGADRYAAVMEAYGRFRPDVILLDDGFQHRRLARNVDVVTIDAANPWGIEKLIPRGTLRESPAGIRRAQAIIATRAGEDVDIKRLERMVRYYDRTTPLLRTDHRPSRLRKAGTPDDYGLATVAGMKVALLSNTADPSSFHRMIEDLGAEIVTVRAAPDHHAHTRDELDSFIRAAQDHGARALIMTAKDERNLPASWSPGALDSFVLDIETVFLNREDERAFLELVRPWRKKTMRREPE